MSEKPTTCQAQVDEDIRKTTEIAVENTDVTETASVDFFDGETRESYIREPSISKLLPKFKRKPANLATTELPAIQ